MRHSPPLTTFEHAIPGLSTMLLLLAGCAATGAPGSEPLPPVTTLERGEALTEVATLDDERSDGGGRLAALATHPDPRVRARACAALGDLTPVVYGAPVTEALGAGLADPDADVRAAAAFALGMRADPAAAPALSAALLAETDDAVRAAMIEAASKIGAPELRGEVLAALTDPSARVRIEAAVGPHRWPAEENGADPRIDAALIEAIRADDGTRDGVPGAEGADTGVAWRALFSLQRRGSAAGRDVFLERARSDRPLERLFAVKGLAQLELDDDVRAGLEHALLDEDWRVVVEGLRGLGEGASPRSVDALERTLGHPSAYVRAAAFEALGYQPPSDRISNLLERARVDRSATVRAAALEAEVRSRGAGMAPDVELKMTSKDPIIRAACARAAKHLPSELAIPYLAELTRDRNTRVAITAIEALGEHPTPASRELLHNLLGGRDNGKRLAAVVALRSTGTPDDLPALRRAFERTRGEISVEVRFNCLLSAEEIGTDEAFELAQDALEDPHPYVRLVAYEVLQRADRAPASPPDVTWPDPNVTQVDGGRRGSNPVVEISTNRGPMTFELFADETPIHVHNFLTLAQDDHYDGLNFHRVVPDFVIQGGCYRGDGNGARPWRGEALRQEIGPRKYVRGSLGMPRNQDMESGGSQFFVTHRPTPHLDGRYTIFGELTSGSLVLDSIEVGDVILDVRLVE